MDLVALSTLVMEKLKEAGVYSELDDEKLLSAIHSYLEHIYSKYFHVAQKKIADDEKRGVFPNQQEYKKQYEMVEDIVMIYANKLAAIDRKEI